MVNFNVCRDNPNLHFAIISTFTSQYRHIALFTPLLYLMAVI